MTDAQQAWDDGSTGMNPGRDAQRHARDLIDLYIRYPDNPEVAKAVVSVAERRRQADAETYKVLRVVDVNDPLPTPVLAADGMDGFLLAVGENMVVAGEGGSGKTAMVTMIAANHACLQKEAFGQLPCRFFHGRGGQVLLVSYEDRTSILREKIIDLVNVYGSTGRLNADICVPADEAVKRVWVLGEKPQEMYGHAEGFHIDTRPEKLPGWQRLWKTVDGMKDLVLLIIDPALAAYTANPNSTPHIRQYLNAISHECGERELACMIVHHSTKDSRFVGSMDEYDENDLFDPGKLSGAAGWSDGIRGGALTMAGRGRDYRKMGIMKASWGSDRVVIDLDPITLYSEDPLWHVRRLAASSGLQVALSRQAGEGEGQGCWGTRQERVYALNGDSPNVASPLNHAEEQKRRTASQRAAP